MFLPSTSLPPQAQILRVTEKWPQLSSTGQPRKGKAVRLANSKTKASTLLSSYPTSGSSFLNVLIPAPLAESHTERKLILGTAPSVVSFVLASVVHSGSETRDADKEALWRPTVRHSTAPFQPGISALQSLSYLVHIAKDCMNKSNWFLDS